MSKVPVKILEWTPVWAVNVPEIDREHQMLFGVLNRLHQAMLAGKGKEILKTLIGEVTQYAQDHFAHEEKLMVAVRYPGLREHVQEHNVLRHGVGPFVARVAREEAERRRAESEAQMHRDEEQAVQERAQREEQERKAREVVEQRRAAIKTAIAASKAASTRPPAGSAASVTMVMNPPPDANRPALTPTPEMLSLTPEPVNVAPPPTPVAVRPPPVPGGSLRPGMAGHLPPPLPPRAVAKPARPTLPTLPRKKG